MHQRVSPATPAVLATGILLLVGLLLGTANYSQALVGPQPGPNIGDIVRIPMLTNIGGIALEAGGSTVLIAEPGSGELSRLDLSTGRVTPIAFVAPSIASPAIEPEGQTAIVITAAGSGNGASGLARVNLVTGAVTTIVERGIDGGTALVIAPGSRTAFVTGSGGLFRVDLETGAVSVVSGIVGLGLVIEPSGTTALVAASCNLMRVDLTTGDATTVATISCTDRPTGVALESGGATALVTTMGQFLGQSGRIFRVDLTSGVVSFLSFCQLCDISHIAVEPSGATVLYVGDTSESLIRFDLSTRTHTALAYTEIPQGMAISPDGTSAITVSQASPLLPGKVSRIDLATGNVNRVAFTGSISGGIGRNVPGTVVFITVRIPFQGGEIQAVDLSTGVVNTIARTPFQQMSSLVLEAPGDTALVVATDGDSLLRVNLGSGDWNVITDQLLDPVAVAIEQDGVSALVIEFGNNGFL
jgi:sugar lactone lactonase YvrE